MRLLFGVICFLTIDRSFSQVYSGAFLLEGSGKDISSIMTYSAYPAQKIYRSAVAMFGGKQFLTSLDRTGFIYAIKAGSHSIMAGGDRFGNDVMHRDKVWASYALPLSKTSNIGIRTGIHYWKAAGYKSRANLSIGVGWSSDITQRLQWRVQVDGIETFWHTHSGTSYLARSVIFYMVSDHVGLSFESIFEEGQTSLIIPAVHYLFDKRIYCRIGALSTINSVGFSLGFTENNWGVETNINLHSRLGIDGFVVVHYKL